ncbi:IclR family transcriptional regulator [Comamonas testosteroni]|uniref:IclR family transcriptional regulator n=1 Tax=Comamonas testosteroni TaxID=285 RepID=UPI0015FBFCFB|nr:IclR family transcriptional regulator [Comamonas testosteroni]
MAHGTQTLERGLGLLKLVAAHHPSGLRLTDLAELSDLELPTVHRLMACLMREGLITQGEVGKRYVLGQYCQQLVAASSNEMPVQHTYGPLIEEIARTTGDATFLVVQSGFDTLCIGRAVGTYPIQALAVSVGHRQPIGVGAGGLAMLAAMPVRDSDALIRTNRERLPYYRDLSMPALKAMVAQARADGYAVIGNYAVSGVIGVGVALHDSMGNIIGGVSVASIKSRMNKERQEHVAQQIKRVMAQYGSVA